MLELPVQQTCRLSGEALADAPVLLDLPASPVPGVYPTSVAQSLQLRSPLKVVQARGSGLVQLAHRFDSSVYSDYGFAADTSRAYRAHLEWFARELHQGLEPAAAVLEVGCGDGLLLNLLQDLGHHDVLGIDPGRAAAASTSSKLLTGFFPDDLPAAARARRYDRIVIRHVLEHIEEPTTFIAALADQLAADGELWIEVPDLDATMASGRWSNFYQLHCNYFDAGTLDRLAAIAGLAFAGGTLVDVFGGSLLRRYRRGPADAPAAPSSIVGAAERFAAFQNRLAELATELPADSVGYGAAERTSLILGACPQLVDRLRAVHDGNPLLHGRYMAGTKLRVGPPAELYRTAPDAVVLFALSHMDEILAQWKGRLSPSTLVAIADDECRLAPLGDL